jgi:hypothetical protein
MKKVFAIFIVSFPVLLCHSQPVQVNSSTNYETIMVSNIRQLDTAAGTSLMMLANNFERIGNAEKTRWEPFYYAAYCYTVMAFVMPDKTKIDWLADKAEAFLQKAISIDKNNSELSCLAAMIVSCRIMVDPVNRFPVMGKEAAMLLQKAKKQNSENPRIYLQEARMQLRTPEAFGGGKKPAKASIETAIAKFDKFIPQNALAPAWGYNQAKAILEKISKE